MQDAAGTHVSDILRTAPGLLHTFLRLWQTGQLETTASCKAVKELFWNQDSMVVKFNELRITCPACWSRSYS